MLTKSRKFIHITPILASLHWLPIQARADFKTRLLSFKALLGLAPPYLSKLITLYTPARPLRSLNVGLLVLPLVKKKTAGHRAFAYCALLLWNNLPSHVKEAHSVDIFKSRLKTHLYSSYDNHS